MMNGFPVILRPCKQEGTMHHWNGCQESNKCNFEKVAGGIQD